MKTATLPRLPLGILRTPYPTRSRWDRALIATSSDSEHLLPTERLLIRILLGSSLYLGQLGVTAAGGSLQMSLIAIYMLGGYQILRETITLSFSRTVAVGFIFAIVFESMLFNTGSSKGSAALALILYAPFAFESRTGGAKKFAEVARLYSTMMIVVDCMGGLQFIIQFAGHSVVEAFNFRTLIPQSLQNAGHYHTIAYSGGLFRSNGFFLREPSTFSIYAALGLICEFNTLRRWKVIAMHAAAMIIALSGSGFIVLFVGLVLPLMRKAPLRILIGAAIVIPSGLMIAPLIGLSSLTDRIAEFSHPGSSGYARFIAPIAFTLTGWSRHLWSLWIGNGPGSILRAIKATSTLIEITDPTWAKLLFEYGLVGSFIFMSAIILWNSGRAAPGALRIAVVYSWLIAGGNFVNPDAVAFMLVLSCMWPAAPKEPKPVRVSRTTTAVAHA